MRHGFIKSRHGGMVIIAALCLCAGGKPKVDKQNEHGNIVSTNRPPRRSTKDFIVLTGEYDRSWTTFGLTEAHLDKQLPFNWIDRMRQNYPAQ